MNNIAFDFSHILDCRHETDNLLQLYLCPSDDDDDGPPAKSDPSGSEQSKVRVIYFK